ncbi:hypothetical protein [Paenibacillus endoradicis]|uniref:hypothetical protein n=1 Tax=Paenibacillus endoradicis TaxID=2972487 RepID=UPI002158A79B|nr:hypothetical protein [Paenibacillus endoradicis]MCR8656953.1 hypothetical protein [Paenibacillus endoradicis]
MELDNIQILQILKAKGFTHLYHANTVKTACSFLKNGGLYSRGAIEFHNLKQTPQSSDNLDKHFNVWNDIFLDSSDLHIFHNRQNLYGPVLFKFNIDILSSPDLPPLWVTNNNPIYWDINSPIEDRYFNSIEEFELGYSNQAVREMITLRDTTFPLLFDPYLEEIILDDPEIKINERNLFKHAKSELKKSIGENTFINDRVIKSKRNCSNCWCKDNYFKQKSVEDLEILFTV